MARPREFDIDAALEKAMGVFWQHGYGDTTLPDLLAGMNLTRGSLYKAFTDKKSLFLRVLATYDAYAVDAAVALLTDPTRPGRDRIMALFSSIAETVEKGDRRGCLLCSTLAGPASYDAEIAAAATRSIDRMQAAFQTALDAENRAGAAPGLAHILTAQYIGLRVLARTPVPAQQIRDHVTAIEPLLGLPG